MSHDRARPEGRHTRGAAFTLWITSGDGSAEYPVGAGPVERGRRQAAGSGDRVACSLGHAVGASLPPSVLPEPREFSLQTGPDSAPAPVRTENVGS